MLSFFFCSAFQHSSLFFIGSFPKANTLLGKIAQELDGRFVPTGEIDFLVLHPELGMLAIEVKGGRLRYNRNVFVNSRTGAELDPVTQVRRSTHALAHWIAGSGNIKYRIGYALAFPESDMQGRSIPPALIDTTMGVPENICIDKPSLPHLGKRITQIMQYWQKALNTWPLSKDKIQKLIDLLCPVVDYSPRWLDRILEDTQRWLLLTSQQSRYLEKFAQQNRTIITGRSGTGKTLLAITYAHELAKIGQQVLFLVYNVQLAEHIRQNIDDISIHVFHYHGLCRQAAISMQQEIPRDSDNWYQEIAPMTLRKAIERNSLPVYDTLIIDEAQVFHKDWLLSLEYWFSNKRILCCCDETQVFTYEHLTPVRDLISIIKAKEAFLLTVNMRSPRSVFERLQQVLPTSYEQFSPRMEEGDALIELVVSDPLKQLYRTLQQLHDEGIPSEAIMVIYMNGNTPPTYPLEVMSFVGKTTSVFRCRGLEAPVVIVWSNGRMDDGTLSCAYSRATSRCIVIYKASEFLRSNESLFFQALKKEVPEASKTIEAVWPPTKTFHLTPVVTHSGIIAWSHDWGGWFVQTDLGDSVANIMWACHLLFESNYPVYVPHFEAKYMLIYTSTQSPTDYSDNGSFSLRWCENCSRWTKMKKIQQQYTCLDCNRPKNIPIPEDRHTLAALDTLLSKRPITITEWQKSSIFLFALQRWASLEHSQRELIQHHISMKERTGFTVSLLLIGMDVIQASPGHVFKLSAWRDYYRNLIPWLSARVDIQSWNAIFALGLSEWINSGWLKKEVKGTYTRLHAPDALPHKRSSPSA